MLNRRKRGIKNNRIKKKYGITIEQYEAIIRSVRNHCQACGRKFNKSFRNSPQLDHNHRTGKIRGVVCLHCNSILGLSNDNTKIIKRAIKYLKYNRKLDLSKIGSNESLLYIQYSEPHKLEHRKKNLKDKFGITIWQLDYLLSKVSNCCQICGREFKENRNNKYDSPHVDHIHGSKDIRGILCCNCNSMLGYAKDNYRTLEKVIKYLKQK